MDNKQTKKTTAKLLALCFILGALFLNLNVNAQGGCMMVPVTLDQRVQQSTTIIEGKVLSQESFWGIGHRNIFTRSTIQVYKVFKGSLGASTIEMITEGGKVGEIAQVLSASLELHVGDMGILTCIPNPYRESGATGYTTYAGLQGFIVYDTDNGSAHDPFNTYYNIETQLHQSIKRLTKRPAIEVAPNPYLETLKRRRGDVNNPDNTNRDILAVPTISGFSPTSITSGTGATLAITGTNFGASQGTGFVEFKNANDGGATWVKPLTTDYVSWSATQIVVKVPSTSQSGPGAGTGAIRVTNSDPNTIASSGTLTITYAYSNYPDTNYARMPTHIKDNSFGGYTFLMNSTFASNTAAVSKLRSVLNYWTCTTQINWLLGGTTTAVAGSDGLNVATFSSSLSVGVLAQCVSWYSSCGGTGTSSNYIVSELDIQVSTGYTWYYGTGTPPASQYDFESVMLHEMGHGHQLNHTIDATAVMHYAIAATQVKRTLNANEIAGATFVRDRDEAIGTVCSSPQMTLLACNAATSAPSVTFTANRTSIMAGCSTTFTSEAAPEVTSWSWNFGGGAPTSTLENPNITFNTPGTYTVTLTATNAYGSGTFTRSSYIVVTAPSCTTTNTNFTGTPTDYTSGTGRLIGHNSSGDLAFADKFTYCASPSTLTQLKYYFNIHTGTGNVIAKVWSADGANGAPGTVLFSQTVAISAIQSYPNATTVTLTTPLTMTGDYYVGYQIVYAGADAVSLISNSQGESAVSSAWRLSSSSVWASYLNLYGSSLSLKVEAVFNNTPTASITPASTTTFCNGGSVVLNSNSSGSYTYSWFKNTVALGITTSSYTATTSGSYTVQVTYGTCSTTSAATVVTVNSCLSTNANLSNLVTSTGTIAPAFASATTAYTLSVSNATSTITVTPTLADATASVKVNGVTVASGSPSGSIALSVGSNTITTIVTAQDGTTTKTYTITVTRSASANADLSNLAASSGTLTPVFASTTTVYSLSVSNATSTMTVTPTLSDATASVKVNGVTAASGSPSGSIALGVGSNTITTVVTAQDGTTTKSYTITVTRAASANANLANLSVSTGTLAPAFATATIAYTLSVSNATSTITVTPTLTDATASVKVNGVTVASGSPSGSIALSVGSNTITTIVTAQDGTTTKSYTITVTRAASANADLSNLAVSSGTLTPVFASTTTVYSLSVSNATSAMTVTPTLSDATASVKVNGVTVTSGSPSGSIALGVGSNTITTVVTAQDGTTTKSYTITVTRAASANANLANLSVSTGTLAPAFATATIAYTLSVSNATSTITVTPTLADATASVKVNGVTVASGSPSGSIALSVGSNTITTIVTAQDGTTTKSYTITVTRAASSNANLSNLTVSTGTLSPLFATGTIAYTLSVPFSTSSMTVTATVSDATATSKVNAVTVLSGSPSGSIALSVGSNTITTIVTAQDGATTKTYTITVTRAAASTNADLSNLVPSAGTLAPAFSTNTITYTLSVPNATSTMTVTPTLFDSTTATVKVNGITVASGAPSGSIALAVGSNTITTIVTAQNGTTTKTYTITVTRAAASAASVVNLTMYIEGYYLSGNTMASVAFNQDGVSSTLNVEMLTVELHHATTYALVATTTAMLHTNGSLSASFNTAPSGSFYIAVKGRSMLQTWSASPQTIGSTPLSYNFTNAVNKAYGNNMPAVASGVFAFYSGDINQDEIIDGSDSTDLLNDIESAAFGNLTTDLNGDGAVDNSDTTTLINNTENSIFSVHP